MISIINYGLGNVRAFKSAYDELNIESKIVSSPKELDDTTHIILPGVGSFDHAIKMINEKGFYGLLDEIAMHGEANFLGVCVGLQIMCKQSSEGFEKGFGWVDALVEKIDNYDGKLPLPHMGWNRIQKKSESPLFKNINNMEFYFLHSFNISPNINKGIITSSVNYGNEMISSISSLKIHGTQFHPEKSHKQGLQLLKNFADISC